MALAVTRAESVVAAIRYVARRGLAVVVTLLVSSFLVFSSLYVAPGDPVDFLVQGRSPSPETIAAVEAQYGLDQPFWRQYVDWLGGVLHGDLGRSFQYRDDVSAIVASRLGTTLLLMAMSAALITVAGLAAGIVGALTAGRRADRALLVTTTLLAATPSFVAAILLISVFGVRLGWFPTFGAGEGLPDRVYHLVLPAIALALTFIALVARVTRSAMLDELGREHVEVATSRGLPRRTVVRRHVLRNALGPITTVSGILVAGLLVSSAVVESAFGLSGLGSLLVQSVDKGDFPVVQAVVLIVVSAFVLVNLVVDLLQPVIDPRSIAGTAAR
ncbi:ABC transporter permease [Nocardioides guangzhouensis]|uniref:ABC transporter permease n=1 Tax=Nocardioides guangzhouensis TaxID=2497878 RepID=UPI001C377A08|nr:ABC transporter permease [Nocardioides guangzhouensis]